MRPITRVLLVAGVALGVLLIAAWFERPGLREYHQHLVPRQTNPAHPTALRATWLGVTALLLRDERGAILIDPFFTRPAGLVSMALNREIEPDPALINEWLLRAGITRLDAVLVSHSHFDHAMDAGVVARLTGARLIGSESTLNVGRGAGLQGDRLVRVDGTDPITLGNFEVRFVEAAHAGATGGEPTGTIDTPLHTPAHYLDYKLGTAYSLLIAHPQGRILHHGSAGYVPGALDGYRADIAFLGVALIDQIEPYLRETVDAVGAGRVVPIHWDNFTKPLSEPLVPMPFIVQLDDFFDDMRRLRPAIQVQTLLPDDPVELFPHR